MPRYSYECTHCGLFEAWATLSDSDEPADCPTCGGMGDRTLAAPFVSSVSGKQQAEPDCGRGACGMCAMPATD